MSHLASRTGLVLATAFLFAQASGCGEDTGDAAAVASSASALDSTADFALVADIGYSAPPIIGTLSVDMARPRLINAIRLGLEALTGAAPCVTIESDEMTFVDAVFNQCGSGDVPVDGRIHGTIDFTTRTCAAGECPTEVLYQLDPIDFTTAKTRLAGAFELRDPVDPLAPMSTSASWTLTRADGSTLGLSTQASWLRRGLCVDLSWDATLTLDEQARAAIGTDIDIMVASARDVSRCAGQCPSKGTVDLAFGQGDVLHIEYSGGPIARVTGPRGRAFDVELPCGAGGA